MLSACHLETFGAAIDRAGLKMGNKGFEAALAAVEMRRLSTGVVGRSSLRPAQDRLRTAVGKSAAGAQA